MFAVLKFDRDLERGFEPTNEYSTEEVFKIELHLPAEPSPVKNVPGRLLKKPHPSGGMAKNNFQWLLHWQSQIEDYKRQPQANTLAIADIREISTTQGEQEIQQVEQDIQNILREIRNSSNNLVLASNQWWQNASEAQCLKIELYNHIIRFAKNRDTTDDSIFYFFIQTDNRAIKQLPWEQLIKQWLLNLFRQYENVYSNISISNLKISINFIPNHTRDLNYYNREILLNQSNQVEVLAVIGSEVKLDNTDEENNLDSILARIQEQNNEQNLNINITKVRPEKCEELAMIIMNTDFDILVFIGHSDINNDRAILQLSSDSQFPITRLNKALNSLNENYSKHRLLILNSCSSLGLAQDIVREHDNISCIAYKEAITDKVSLVDFLTQFFKNFRNPENSNLSKVMLSTKRDFNLTSESNDFSMEVSWFPIVILPSKIQEGNKQIIPLIQIKHPETYRSTTDDDDDGSYFKTIKSFFKNITILIQDFTLLETRFTVLLRTILGCFFGAILYLLQLEYLSFWSQFGVIFGFMVFLLEYSYLMSVRSISRNYKFLVSLCPIIIASIILVVLIPDSLKNFKFDITMFIEVIIFALIAYLSPKVFYLFYR